MNSDQRTATIGASRAARRVGLTLAIAIALGACGSTSPTASNGPTENSATETITTTASAPEILATDSPPPASRLDQSMSFGRPVEPFEGDVVTVRDGENINVYAESSAKLLGSHPLEAEPWSLRASHQHGAVYVTSQTSDQLLQISRLDASGIETIRFERRGFVDHVVDAPVASILVQTDEFAELVRFQNDGQVDRHIFDTAVFIEAVGDAVLVGKDDFNGDLWVLDQDLNVTKAVNIGDTQSQPLLLNSETVRFAVRRNTYELDVDTEEVTVIERFTNDPDARPSSEFGDGWRVEAGDDVVDFLNPAGDVVNSFATEPVQSVSSFAHPTENVALVVLRTCENREGSTCQRPDSDSEGGDSNDEGGDEAYIPPSFIRIVQFDIDDASITHIDAGEATSLAAMAIDSHWAVATVDGSAATISSIARNGDIETFAQVPSHADYTLEYVIPVGSRSFGLSNWDESQTIILTDEGMQLVDGRPLTNQSAWQQYNDRFAHVG